MVQTIIKNVLQALLGYNSPALRHYMRPDNRIQQFLIARQLIKHYIATDNLLREIAQTGEETPAGEQIIFNHALFRAVVSEIDEELESYSSEALNTHIRNIILNGPHPPGDTLFFTGLFSPAPPRP